MNNCHHNIPCEWESWSVKPPMGWSGPVRKTLSGPTLTGQELKGKRTWKKKKKNKLHFSMNCESLVLISEKKKQRKSVDVKKSFSLTFWSFLVSSFGWNKILLFSTLSGYIIKCCAGEGWTEKYLALIQDTQALLHFVHRLCPQAKYLPGA